MKLYQYDLKHEQVHGELDLGGATEETIAVVHKIIGFLRKNGLIDDRYKCLTIANGYTIVHHDGEPEVIFH